MTFVRALLAPALVLALLAGAACDADGRDPAAPPLRPAWQAVPLPLPPGPPGRIALRDATVCGGDWYLVGAVLGPEGASRPAAWHSADGRAFVPVPLAATDYWARRAILYSVACRDGAFAALGARSGGAHGNPRVTSWHQRSDGTLVDVRAGFELFGGPDAVSVTRLVAGEPGWLIAGTRTSGAAVWLSADATGFRLHDHAPGLADAGDGSTAALDAVAGSAGWTVVGRSREPGRVAPVPAAWSSADGRTWLRQPLPAETEDYAELQRVVVTGEDVVAAGLRGDRFGLWRRSDDSWTTATTFSRVARGTGRAAVSGLAAVGADVLVAVSDGARHGLWAQADGWHRVEVPVRPQTSGDHQLTVTSDGSDVLLVGDDGREGRVWRARWPD